ncbi:MAG TPA: endolytic transglycosylase MltG [Verrucomicrobiae bacterium]|nr:endolytic transglycosylase MltG [Verrucomicrobiae bacterium]
MFRRLRALLFGILLLALLAGAWFVSAAWFGGTPSAQPVTFTVTDGETGAQVASELSSAHLVVSAWAYRAYGWFDRSVSRPKPGDYELRSGMSYRDIARELATGPARREVQVRIIEGRTVDELADQLHNEQGIAVTTTQSLIGRSANRASFDPALRDSYPFLKSLPGNRSLEGYLFPDTYRVWGDQLPDALIHKQLDEFGDRFGTSTVTAASAPLKSLDEVVILASIIEAEVPNDDDRRIVAGIFLNRLKAGIALQSDATLSYITGSDRARASVDDLNIDSPFNTYKNRGLPPAPINSPGASAIQAVLNPVPNEYLYFLTDKEGKVYYAKTLEEHTANRRKAGF